MTRRGHALLSGLLLMLVLLGWVVIALLVFYVPYVEKMWADMNQAAPGWMRLLFGVSAWVGGRTRGQTIPGVVFLLWPLLVLTIGALVWRVWAAFGHRRAAV